eukprot:scaffold112077_cov32-Tisochrysis_lutea.AAC.1
MERPGTKKAATASVGDERAPVICAGAPSHAAITIEGAAARSASLYTSACWERSAARPSKNMAGGEKRAGRLTPFNAPRATRAEQRAGSSSSSSSRGRGAIAALRVQRGRESGRRDETLPEAFPGPTQFYFSNIVLIKQHDTISCSCSCSTGSC